MTPLNTLAERKGLLAIASLASAILLIGALVPGYYVWTINYAINPLTDSETIDLPKTTGATIDQYIKIYWPLYKAVYEPGAVAEVVEGEEGEEEVTFGEKYAGFPESYHAFIGVCEDYVRGLMEEKTAYLEKLGYVAPILLPTFGTEFILNEEPKKLHIDKPVDVVFQIPAGDAHVVQGRCFWVLIVFIGIFEQGDVDKDDVPYELVDVAVLAPSIFQHWKILSDCVNLPPGKYDVVIKIFTWTGAVEDFQKPTEGSFRILIYAVEKPLPIPIEEVIFPYPIKFPELKVIEGA